MTRIRKRPSTANSSVSAPQLLANSNGGHTHIFSAGPKSNPRFQDPGQSLLCPSGWFKKDRLVRAGASNSGHGESAVEGAEEQLVATPATLFCRTPYNMVAPSQSKPRGNEEHILESREHMNGALQQRHGCKGSMHRNIVEDDGNCSTCLAKGVMLETKRCSYAGSEERSAGAATGNDPYEPVIKQGSTQLIHELRHTDLSTDADDGAAEQPRKVLPLQLILKSGSRTSAAAAIKASRAPSFNNELRHMADMSNVLQQQQQANGSSGTSTSCNTSTTPRKPQDKGRDGGAAKTWPLHKAQRLPFMSFNTESEVSDVKIMQARGAHNQEGAAISGEQSLEWPVSSWQGLRRARSLGLQGGGGRITNGTLEQSLAGGSCPNTLLDMKEDKVKENSQLEKKASTSRSKKPLQKIKVVTSPQGLISAGDGSKKRTHATAFQTPDFASPLNPTAVPQASDHSVYPDCMRCRRKDGRRWRCKDQVVKPGAPFCAYHTVKMKEKHAASVARRLRRKLQNEHKGEVNRKIKTASRRQKLARRSVIFKGGDNGGGSGRQGEPERKEEGGGGGGGGRAYDDDDDEEEEDEFDSSDEIERAQVAQELAMSGSMKSRWRKKCKPCIRRLHDIQDRARPAVVNHVESNISCRLDEAAAQPSAASVWVVQQHSPSPAVITSNNILLSLRPPAPPSPLPECQFNTDPCEWRPDFS